MAKGPTIGTLGKKTNMAKVARVAAGPVDSGSGVKAPRGGKRK